MFKDLRHAGSYKCNLRSIQLPVDNFKLEKRVKVCLLLHEGFDVVTKAKNRQFDRREYETKRRARARTREPAEDRPDGGQQRSEDCAMRRSKKSAYLI